MVGYICVGYGKKVKFDEISECFDVQKEVSVVLPTYNEEGNIRRIVDALKEELKEIDLEIVIVDDNSKDKTPEIMDSLAKEEGIIALHRYSKKGIFSAIKDGVRVANGKYVVTMDSDFSHPPKVINELWKHKDAHHIVSGSRFSKGGGMEAPAGRKYGSMMINRFCAMILGVKQKDIAGGFHLIEKEKFEELDVGEDAVFGEFDFEIFYKAKKKGWKILEVPFVYRFREEGESKMGGESSSKISEIMGLLRYAGIYFKKAFKVRLMYS